MVVGFPLPCYPSARMHSKGYGAWFVSVSVCLSVTTFSATTRKKSAKLQRVQSYTGLIVKKAIFIKKILHSKVMVQRPSGQANMLGLPRPGPIALFF